LLHDYDVCWKNSRHTTDLAIPAQPHGRGQRGRAPETPGYGPRSRGGHHQGKLDLGPWEQIFYGEFDGRRRKRVLVKSSENNIPTYRL